LIDVKEIFPFLFNTREDQIYNYIALSYAWGEAKQLKTLKINLESHLQRLPTSNLPRTIAEAIRVARDLGYCYIWIDAICIVQDDSTDMSRELPKMGDIYRFADVTIYAAGAKHSNDGFLIKRDYRQRYPCNVTLTIENDQKEIMTRKVALATSWDGEDHLESRGWVMQERILSTRRLIFGDQMSWSCTTAQAQETNPYMQIIRRWRDPSKFCAATTRSNLYSALSLEPKDTSAQFVAGGTDSWQMLVQDYSDKNLTYVEDNVKALSGLAALFQKAYSLSFVAGLWKQNLAAGLSWYVAMNDERPVARVDGPTWSWPSVGQTRVKFRGRATDLPGAMWTVDITQVSCKPEQASNPFGPAKTGILNVKGRPKQAIIQETESWAEARRDLAFGTSLAGTGNLGFAGTDSRAQPRYPAILLHPGTRQPLAEVALDHPGCRKDNEICQSAAGKESMATFVLIHIGRKAKTSRVMGYALVLEEGPDDSFRRKGLAMFEHEEASLSELMGIIGAGTQEIVTIV
jgi:hypothetical protein